MIEGDPLALFGGLVLVNFPVDEEVAGTLLIHHTLSGGRRLLDGVIAPSFTDDAVDLLRRKGDKCRFLANPALEHLTRASLDTAPRFVYERGGFLIQPNYTFVLDFNDSRLEKSEALAPGWEKNLLLAWAIGSTSNSNTVTLVGNGKLIGNGVGQQDRVAGCELAIRRANRAGHLTMGAVAYSDSFFPFTDGPELLAQAGVHAILTSRGSVADEEVKAYCASQGVVLYMIPDVHGRGFFGH